MTTPRKLGLLAALYLAQGLPFGFFTQALPVVLRQDGYSLPWVGAASVLALPWAFKFLWAPLVDRWNGGPLGPRRSWILPLQALTVLALLGLAAVDPGRGIAVLAVGMLVTSALAATQDIATDGLAVDVLAEPERGLGNGVQVAGYRLGMILGGGALLVVYDHLGQAPVFVAMALGVGLASLPVLAWREPPRPDDATPPGLADLVRGAGGLGTWLAAIAVYKLGEAAAKGMFRPLLVDLGWTMSDVGWAVGTAGSVAGLLGALAGGAATGRLGVPRAVLAFGAFQALAVALWAAVPTLPVLPVLLLEHFASGTATAALFTAMMNRCRPDAAATDFTVQASIVVFGSGLGAALGGLSAEALGYSGHFVACALFAAIAAAWVGREARGSTTR